MFFITNEEFLYLKVIRIYIENTVDVILFN